ncbi:cytochrome c/FTR1 family iron permease [Sphingorhabdus sp. YGSMI21]|uniref:cytochrome c/FTR1 family iron permease n=1 Tax=Sphingorhabdus sp. YGSMI21 TaxID=2077182 RepID=UPI000C1E91F1|nr:cytochrome c/FTR1 family iron permease [Sphingorhabdus sp. YGSMI21]ATW05791.1 iron permease [Sphingorhabdus sp. YGSMI21]
MRQCARIYSILLSVLALVTICSPIAAQTKKAEVETLWRLLDYIAVDYPGAVDKGKVINEAEYSEMEEFSGTVVDGFAKLAQNPNRADLIAKGNELNTAIDSKASPDAVARQARSLATDLLRSYPVPLAPKAAPNMQNGKQLYAQNCASCHGTSGNGQGPDAGQLNPAPIAFTDVERARERSLFALYQVIGQGLDGTAMQSFADLPAQDRWDMAAYAGSFAFKEASKGQGLWKNDASIRALFPDLAALVSMTSANLGKQIGPERADAVMAFLRNHPEAVGTASSGSLALSRTKLKESLAAYQAGRKDEAEAFALSAYLDGFEPLEPALASRDPSLLKAIERAMARVRAAIGDDLPVAEVESRIGALDGLFSEAETALDADQASQASAFVGAFTILLREGLEALLIVVAMIAFLRKAERPEVMPYVHGGWITALLAGGITWFAATYLIGISGASRELTEGFGSLFAAVILLFVGLWMHGKSRADEWQRYIRETMSKALSRGSAWFLFGLAFIVVYREVFETILFFAALWTADNGMTILAGSGVAILLLSVIAWAMLRYSQKLPIGKFFAYSSALMIVLTVILTGKGIAALQEAGLMSVTPLSDFPQIAMLGIFPAVQSLIAQVLVIAVIAAGYWYNVRLKYIQDYSISDQNEF